MEEFNLSPKFLVWLEKRKNIDPEILTEAYKKYREEQNYPFLLQDMRIAMQSNFKGLCQVYATMSLNEKISTDEIWEEARKKTIEMFKDKFFEENKEKKYKDMTEEEKEKIDERNRKMDIINQIIKERSFEWLEKVQEMAAKKAKKKGE